jgi:peroxiredoxin
MLQPANNDHRHFSRPPLALPLAAALALLCVRGAPAGEARAGAGAGEVAGTLRTHYSEFDLLLIPAQGSPGQAGGVKRVESRGGTASVAPGSYYLLEWRVHAQDAAGRHWRAQGNAWPDPFLVPAAGNAQLSIAFPLRAYLNCMESNGQIHFQLEYAGPFGERCGDVTVDELPPAAPSIRIMDDRGRLLTRIRFDRQHGAACHAAWKIPAGLTGRFHAIPEPNLGPFRVDVGPGLSFELRAARMVRVPARVGRPAPDFSLMTSGGQTMQLGFMRPRPVILCFFCNCGLCHAVATELAAASDLRDPASPGARAQIVVVTHDPSVLEESFRRETGLPGVYLNDTPPMVAPLYASEACPRCWLIDEQGIVRYVNKEQQMPAKALVTRLRAVLAEPRPKVKPQDLSALRPPLPASVSPSAHPQLGTGPRRVAAKAGPLSGGRGQIGRSSSPAVASAAPGLRGPDRGAGFGRSVPRAAAPALASSGRGVVEAGVRDFGMTLLGSGQQITLESHTGPAPVAAGAYDVLNWWASLPDAEGRLWRVRGGTRPGGLTVEPHATARLCLITPLQAHFLVLDNPGEVQFLIYLESSSLGRCSSVTVDGRDAPRPHVEVRDATGSVIADLECSYCCGFKASVKWHPPADAHGPFTAVPKIDYGPMKVVADPPQITLEPHGKADAASNNP